MLGTRNTAALAGLAATVTALGVALAATSPQVVGQSLPRTPANAKPKPAETQPATTTPAEKKPVAPKPAETKPADKQPAETKPQEKPKGTKGLEVGSPAPRFEPDAWIKGQSVSGFEKGKVYVVEFWATWCGPCRESIPHLTKIQKDNKELIVIGMASYERQGNGSSQDNRRTNVEKFVKEQGDKMDYRVAFETDDQVGQAWMDAAKRNGIPTAFVVDGEGKIAFIGSPMSGSFDSAIQTALKAAKGS